MTTTQGDASPHVHALSPPETAASNPSTSSPSTFSGNHEPASNILIDNVIAWTGCHAFKLGQGSGQTISGVTFRNSVVFDAAHGISIHHKAGVGVMENSTWEGIDIQKLGASNLGRSWLYVNIESTGTGPGNVRNMTLKDIRVRDFGTDNGPRATTKAIVDPGGR